MSHSSSGQSLNQYALRRDLLNTVVSWVQSPGPKCRFNHHQPNPGLSTEVLLVAGAGGKHDSSCLVGGRQGLKKSSHDCSREASFLVTWAHMVVSVSF